MRSALPVILKILSWISFFIYLIVFIIIISYLISKSGSAFSLESIFGDADPFQAILLKEPVFDGLFPAIFGTLSLVIVSISIAVPLGVSCGVWLSEYAKGWLYKFISVFLDILSGLPSIVIGLFGLSIILVFHEYFPEKNPGFSILVSSCALALVVLPYIARSTETSLNSLNHSLRLSVLSLGASRIETIRYVLLPNAFPSIFSGILLSIARCAEDTAVIMLTGAVASAGIPHGIMERFEALPFFIYYTSSEYGSAKELGRAFDAALILIIIVFFLFILSFISNKIALRGVKRAS